MDIRHEFSSFHDPMAAYTSLGSDMESSFVTADFPYERKGSFFSSSSVPSLAFGETPTEAGSIPSTPVGDGHRSTGAMTPADMLMTPESPCPPSWKSSYGRHAAFSMHGGAPRSRFSTSFHDLTRNMVNAGATHDFAHHTAQPLFGRELAYQDLDPIHTGFKANSFPTYHDDISPSESFASSTRTLASWDDDEDGSSEYAPSPRSLKSNQPAAKVRKARSSRPGIRSTLKKPEFPCKWPGCDNKRFARKEHLRRHENTKHCPRKYECLQGRILGARFCNKVMGLNPISRSDNVNQHSCTHVINGMGKTRNALCELAVSEACMKADATTQAGVDKAEKQCKAQREQFVKAAEEAVSKGIKISKPKPNVHIAHDIMSQRGFDCSQGCPMGPLHVFEGGYGRLCMAYVPESHSEQVPELDGDVPLTTGGSSMTQAKL